ncbi:hypothetical protein BraRD5C2_16400 [Bradyrhizobium sp. RD5-C2]|nr:hypothetical protein BraRD5C2_16400 [Bradyrhizobium sp. RD5-C2]
MEPTLYRAYAIGRDDRILSRVDLHCASDADAIQRVQDLVDRHSMELWKGAQLLRKFAARQ